MGDPDASLSMYQKAWALDPRSVIIGINLAWEFIVQQRYDEGEKIAKEVLSFAPEFPEVLNVMFDLNIYRNDCTEAKKYLEKLAGVLGKPITTTQVYLDLCQRDDPELRASAIEAILAWPEIDFANPDNPSLSYDYDLVDLFTELGELEAAWVVLERISDDPSNLTWLRNHSSPNSIKLQCDPRVLNLIEQHSLPPAIYPVQCN
jgi:tetratricopeptide (TPR) repeat protein